MKGKENRDIYVEAADDMAITTGGINIPSESVVDKTQGYAKQFSRVGEYIMNVGSEIYDKYKTTGQSVKPDEIEVQFGIKLSGKPIFPLYRKAPLKQQSELKRRGFKSKEQV